MKAILLFLIALLMPAAPVRAQAPVPTVDPLVKEIRGLKKEAQHLRRDLAQARGETRKSAEGLQALREEAEAEGTQRANLERNVSLLTAAVVLLGGIACLALIVALAGLRRRGAEQRRDTDSRAGRIAELRARLEADEARLAALQARSPAPAPRTNE